MKNKNKLLSKILIYIPLVISLFYTFIGGILIKNFEPYTRTITLEMFTNSLIFLTISLIFVFVYLALLEYLIIKQLENEKSYYNQSNN